MLNMVSLSNDTVRRRSCDSTGDIQQQVNAEIKEDPLGIFAIQLGESTNTSSYAQLLVHTRYIKDSVLKEVFLFYHSLGSTMKGEDTFEAVSNFFEKDGLS